METDILIVLVIWFSLGVHSAFFLRTHLARKYGDYNDSEYIPIIVACVLLPLITHLATIIVFYTPTKENK